MKAKTVNSDGNVALAKYLESLRLEKGISKSKLGSRLGVTNTVIKQTEQHERRLDLIELVRYCKALVANPANALQVLVAAESSAINEENE